MNFYGNYITRLIEELASLPGIGGKSARGNLRETFEIMDTIYSIDDMENGVIGKVFL